MARFQTLNAALQAGHPDCVALWPLGTNVTYNSTERVSVPTGDTYGRSKLPVCRIISVYRDERGLYEEAITYLNA